MVSSSELTQDTSNEVAIDSLRLLSVNEAREILKIRHEAVKKLIEDGKIDVIIIGKRIKIPMRNLNKFIEENSRRINEEEAELILTGKQEFIRNKVKSIIKNQKRRYK